MQLLLATLAAALVGAPHLTAQAKPLAELWLGHGVEVDPERVNCTTNLDLIDECGLQQGFSFRHSEFGYPADATFLASSCTRQHDAIKCLRAHAKCLQPLAKQLLLAMMNSRSKYVKKTCESGTRVIEMRKCLHANKAEHEKAIQAEHYSIAMPEAIVLRASRAASGGARDSSLQERLKQSCCAAARSRTMFMDAVEPACRQHSQTAAEMIDSYLRDTIGIICPEFESMVRRDCDKLPKLALAKTPRARYIIRPIIDVIQTLQADS